MRKLLLHADDVLRRRSWSDGLATVGTLPATILLFGMCYGAAMGTYGGFSNGRSWQVLYSGVKVPLMLLATFAISLPSFYVLNALLGLRRDFQAAIYALLATQAGVSIILASLAPFTVLWYLSTTGHDVAIVFNGMMFAIATFSAQVILRGYYQPLIARNHRHRWMLRVWALIYSFVGIQMGWLLRPFVGDPDKPVEFFRAESWGNAYVTVARLLWQVAKELICQVHLPHR